MDLGGPKPDVAVAPSRTEHGSRRIKCKGNDRAIVAAQGCDRCALRHIPKSYGAVDAQSATGAADRRSPVGLASKALISPKCSVNVVTGRASRLCHKRMRRSTPPLTKSCESGVKVSVVT